MDILKKVSTYNIRIKIAIITLLALSTAGVVLYVKALSDAGFYEYLNSGLYKARDVNTPLKLWLNGYLGIFFRVHEFGFLILLLLPCYLYIIVCWEKVSRAVRALVVVFSISAILIGIKGFLNYRYAFTLFPFAILSIFWIAHAIFDGIKEKIKSTHSSSWIFITVMLYVSIGFLWVYSIDARKDSYVKHWNYANQVKGPSMDLIHSLNKLNTSGDRKILVVNINGFFYHTNLKGVTYDALGLQDNSEALWQRIQKENIRYVLVENYIFVLPEYKLLADLLKDGSKAKLFKKGGALMLFVVRKL